MVGGLVEAASEYKGVRFVRPGDVADLRQALLELPTMGGRTYSDPHSWDRSVEGLEGLLAVIRNGRKVDDHGAGEAKPARGTRAGAAAAARPRAGDVWARFAAGEGAAGGEPSGRLRRVPRALRGRARG
jgi:hypothetical protein